MTETLSRVYLPRAALAVATRLASRGALTVPRARLEQVAVDVAAAFIELFERSPGAGGAAVEDWSRQGASPKTARPGPSPLDALAGRAARALEDGPWASGLKQSGPALAGEIAAVLRPYAGLAPSADAEIRASLGGLRVGTLEWDEAYHRAVEARAAGGR